MITVKSNKIRQASTLFSNAFFKKVIIEKDTSLLKKYVTKYIDTSSGTLTGLTYQDIISTAYKCFEDKYRFEYLYKNQLLNELLIKKYKGKDTIVLSEFSVSKSIADLILINGSATLYEIKTELDRTYRLESQISNYYKCFDKVSIVTHESLVTQYSKLAELYNSGLIIYNNKNKIEEIKKPQVVQSELCHLEIFKLLRKHEVLSLLKKEGLEYKEIPNTKFFNYYLDVFKNIDIKYFQQIVFQEIKLRKLYGTQKLLSSSIPVEIKLIYNCLSLSEDESAFLLKLLRQPIKN